jgi:hypothetical protein
LQFVGKKRKAETPATALGETCVEKPKLGTLLGFSITVRVPIVGALGILVIALCLGYILAPTYRDSLTFLALAITAAATIGGTFYVAETIRDQAVQRQRGEAFALMARWNSPDLFYSRKAWSKISSEFQLHGGGAVKTLLQDPASEELQMNVRHILNFLEEIAIAIKSQHADEELLKDAFKSIIFRAGEALKDWIPEHRRVTGRNDIWDQFDDLYTKWTKPV